jgi:hypothetical protein
LIVEHDAITQVWLFIVAPMVGAIVAAGLFRYLVQGVPEPAHVPDLGPSVNPTT